MPIQFLFAQSFVPWAIIKEIGDEQLINGAIPGEIFFNYIVDGEIIFKVVESLTPYVDEIIEKGTAQNLLLVHQDPDVIYFCERKLIEKNLWLNNKPRKN